MLFFQIKTKTTVRAVHSVVWAFVAPGESDCVDSEPRHSPAVGEGPWGLGQDSSSPRRDAIAPAQGRSCAVLSGQWGVLSTRLHLCPE